MPSEKDKTTGEDISIPEETNARGGELTDEEDAKLDKFIEEGLNSPEFKKLVEEEQANHSSDEDLSQYVFQQLAEERREKVLKHLSFCDSCFKEVKELEDMSEKLKEDYLNTVLPTPNGETTPEPSKTHANSNRNQTSR